MRERGRTVTVGYCHQTKGHPKVFVAEFAGKRFLFLFVFFFFYMYFFNGART